MVRVLLKVSLFSNDKEHTGVNDLIKLWTQCLQSLQAPSHQITSGWLPIEKAYTRKVRHYHNLHHLDYMYRVLQPAAHLLENKTAVWLALFFHDLVYSVRRHDNEERSAAEAGHFLRSVSAGTDLIEAVSNLILATKKHTASSSNDINLFTDADLCILGAAPGLYKTYTLQIRKEYRIYPNILYKPGRRKVLEHFLNMQCIFKTDYFHQQYETQARINLQTEREALQ
jgi:predicted metal-dependent HD superfamily phosphohydrolase